LFQFYNFIKQTGVFFRYSSAWLKHIAEDPVQAPETSVTFVKYDGSSVPVPEGVEDLKKRLREYLGRVNGGKPQGGKRDLEGEFFKAAGMPAGAKL